MDVYFSIRNLPEDAKHYKYIIAKVCDTVGNFEFVSMTNEAQDAENTVADIKSGIVIHNPNAEPPAVEKYYSFTGTWSVGVYATSKEEAIKLFQEIYPEDYNFSDYSEIEEFDD